MIFHAAESWLIGAAAAALVWLVWLGAGAPLARWLALPAGGGATGSLLTGVPVVGLVVLALAQTGLVRSGLLALLVGLAGVAGCPVVARLWRNFRAVASGDRQVKPWLEIAAVVLVFAGAVAVARVPLVMIDTKIYHLGIPEEILHRGRWVSNPWDLTWLLPSMAEMGFLPAYALAGIIGARAVNLATVMLLLLTCGAVASALVGPAQATDPGDGASRRASWTAAALLAGCGLPFHLACDLKNDLAAAVAVSGVALAATWCITDETAGCGSPGRRGRSRWVALGMWAGLAAATKLTAAIPAAVLVAAAWFMSSRVRWHAVVVLAAGSAVLGPWLVQNELLTGNPLLPFAFAWFGGLHWSADLERGLASTAEILEGAGHISPRGWMTALIGFGAPRFGSVLLGLFLPLALMRGGGNAGLSLRMGGAISFFVFLCIVQTPRFLLPWLSLAAALAGAAWVGRPVGQRMRQLTGAGLIASAVLALAPLWTSLPPEWVGVMTGRMTQTTFAERVTPIDVDFREWSHSKLSPADTLLVLCDQRQLGLNSRVLAANMISDSPVRWAAHEAANPLRLAVRFRQLGITCFAHNLIRARFQSVWWNSGLPWTDQALATYRAWFSQYARLAFEPRRINFEHGAYYVWWIRSPALPEGPGRADLRMLPGTEGVMAPAKDVLIAIGSANVSVAEALVVVRRLAARIGPVLDAENWFAMTLCIAGREREALPYFERERRLGYVNERNGAWHATVLRGLHRDVEARTVEAEVLARSGGDPAALLHHPLLEKMFPVQH